MGAFNLDRMEVLKTGAKKTRILKLLLANDATKDKSLMTIDIN